MRAGRSSPTRDARSTARTSDPSTPATILRPGRVLPSPAPTFLLPRRSGPQYGDRAVGVVQCGVADRTEQQTAEATAAVTADHEQLRPGGLVDQHLGGLAGDALLHDVDPGVLLAPLSQASVSAARSWTLVVSSPPRGRC